MEIPEFTAHEINKLSNMARKSAYYAKCLKFIKDTVLNDICDISLSDKQIKWLWGIKMDLKDEGL